MSGSDKNKHKKKSRKRKTSAKAKAHRIEAMIGVLIVAFVVVVNLLIRLGVVTENQILVFMGLADKPASNAEMSVHFIDVGQGDCELIICNGEACLIDCGERDKGKEVAAYLKAQNITELRYFIISHQHTDHMGCADEIMEEFEIGSVIMPQIPDELIPTNSIYESFLDTAYELDVQLYEEAVETTLELGGCEIYIYPQSISGEYDTLNDYSLCVKVVHGENSFLFAGDAERAEELSLTQSGFDLSAKVMKVNHHGSAGSSSYEFLEAVGARYAVIEVGEGNSYGHPTDAAMSRIEKYCEYVYRTDEDGTVVFESDGSGLNILTERDS